MKRRDRKTFSRGRKDEGKERGGGVGDGMR